MENWIPVSSTGMTRYKPYRHAAANRHTAIHSRYLSIDSAN
ncbi:MULTISPECIES: hypothetical protein [unclassified Wolbachia]|nr:MULTISPECIES: hypothetical protein [unclassified Wolbachia]